MEEIREYHIFYNLDGSWHYLITLEATSEENAIEMARRLMPKFRNYELKHFNYLL